ncbi:MAG: S16 family serine protease [Planctomycetaceae bacterium]
MRLRVIAICLPCMTALWCAPDACAQTAPREEATGSQRPVITPRTVLVVQPPATFTDDEGIPTGTCINARVEVGGAPAGRPRIGVYEPEVGGTTDVWRAASWSAALVAAQLTNFDPRAVQLSVEVRRSTDGPSAGALMTVAIVAAIRGDTLRNDTTMTGTINPDGTIGPVGGIPLKIEGVAGAGKSRLLIPSGQLTDVDPRTDQAVDLARYGKAVGVEVLPVRNVREAYMALTGVELPHGRAGDLPDIPAELKQLTLQRIERWVKMSKSAAEKYYGMNEASRTAFSEHYIDRAKESFELANEFKDDDAISAAYMEVVQGALYVWVAHEYGRYTYAIQHQGLDGAIQLPVHNSWLVDQIQDTTDKMRRFRPKTISQMGMYLNAGRCYFEGLCANDVAEDFKRLQNSTYIQTIAASTEFRGNSGLDKSVFALQAGLFQIIAWIDMKLAEDLLILAESYGGEPFDTQPQLVHIAEYYRRGAEANMTLVDGLLVVPQAREQEVPADVLRAFLPVTDSFYGTAHVGLDRVMDTLPGLIGPGEQLEYIRLAAAMYLHSVTATLIAEYYSIGVTYDTDGRIAGVVRPAALQEWIETSRAQSEEVIQTLLAHNVDASICLQSYWLARARERKKDPIDRFFTLQNFFHTNLMSQVFLELARASENPELHPVFDDGRSESRLPYPPPEPTGDAALPAPPQPTDDVPPPAAPKVQ